MDSPALTPNGGEFLSQLGKTWNLIQTKAKELEKSKKKQKKTEHELNETRARYEIHARPWTCIASQGGPTAAQGSSIAALGTYAVLYRFLPYNICILGGTASRF